jgi:diacylglycerol kinase family enzyme
MADARNRVDFDDIGVVRATFKIDGVTIVYDATKTNGAASTMLNKAVTLSADDTVALAVDGDAVIGKLLLVESDSKCVVQVEGFCDLPAGASASVTRGLKIVGALGAASAKGYIREVASATAAEINKGRGRIIRNGTTTAVVVQL